MGSCTGPPGILLSTLFLYIKLGYSIQKNNKAVTLMVYGHL